MTTGSLDIVIVNWNSGDLLRECMQSIVALGGEELDGVNVVIVDNASTDGSCEDLPRVGARFKLVQNERNVGFSQACNQGAAIGEAEFILFLNPDMRLEPGSLAVPLCFMESAPWSDVGICGIQLLDEFGQVSKSCSRFPSARVLVSRSLGLLRIAPGRFGELEMASFDHAENRSVDHVMGAFFFVRRDLFMALEGFDERFYLYFEDMDFSLRARQFGQKSMFIASASAYHIGRGSSDAIRPHRTYLFAQSEVQYAWYNLSHGSALLVTVFVMVVEPVARAVASFAGGSNLRLSDIGYAYGRLWASVLSGSLLRISK